MEWTVRFSIVACLIALAAPAWAQDFCREVFFPPDDIRLECFSIESFNCDDLVLSFEQEAVCEELCSEPGAGSDPACSSFIEERCGLGGALVEGRCLEDRPVQDPGQDLQCIDRQTVQRIEPILKEAEAEVEERLANVIALAAARRLPVTLRDGRAINALPEDDTDESKRLRESIEKLAKDRGISCEVANPLAGCVLQLTDFILKQEEKINGEEGLFDQIRELAEPGMGPQFEACQERGAPMDRRFGQQGLRATQAKQRYDVTSEFGQLMMQDPDAIRIECARPDITTCTIQRVPTVPGPPREPGTGRA